MKPLWNNRRNGRPALVLYVSDVVFYRYLYQTRTNRMALELFRRRFQPAPPSDPQRPLFEEARA
jgi:hypothetical protein